MSQVTVGEECKTEELAEWLRTAKEHMIFLTLTKPAVKAGSDMLRFLQQTVAASALQALSQQGGHNDNIQSIEIATAHSSPAMKTAAAAAASSKFRLQVFDDTYVFASKFSISFIGWTEWDGGTSLSKFGSLRFFFP